MAELNAYAILGLQKGATDQDIKVAFVELVKKYDPEKHTDRFMVIQSAYNKLKDTKKRAKEDIHTYNTFRGEFLFTPDEQCVYGTPPPEDEINAARVQYQKLAGDAAARETIIQVLMKRSHAFVGKKMWTDAIKDWEEVRAIDPSHIRSRNNLMLAYMTLGLSYALHGLNEDAIEMWENALKLNPDNADLVHNLALGCEKSGMSEKAARYWSEAVNRWKNQLKKDPDNEYLKECIVEAHRYHGGQFEQSKESGDKNIAINRYKQVLELKPDDFDARFHIAQSYINDSKFTEAQTELEALTSKHPKNIEVLNLLGWAQLNLGQGQTAFNTWNRALSIDPKSPATREHIVKAHLMLGKQCRQKGMFTQALVHFKTLLRFLPGSAEVFMEIAATYDMKGDTRAAVQTYDQVLQIDPKNKLARKALNDIKLRR